MENRNIISFILALQNLWISRLLVYSKILQIMLMRYKRRRQIFILAVVGNSFKHYKNKHVCRGSRKYWVRPRWTNIWWLSFKNNVVTPSEWIKNFWMSQDSFLIHFWK